MEMLIWQGPLRINANAGLRGSGPLPFTSPSRAPRPRRRCSSPTGHGSRSSRCRGATPPDCRYCPPTSAEIATPNAPATDSIFPIVEDLVALFILDHLPSASPRCILFLDVAFGSWFQTPTAASSPRPS